MRSLVVATTIAALAAGAAADPPRPTVLALVERTVAGGDEIALRRVGADGARADVLAGLPLGGYGLAVHAGTGRWVLSFHQLPEGAPLTIAGVVVSEPNGRATLVFGEGARVVATVFGDPACTSKRTACFETPIEFSPDGAYVFVRSEAARWTTWGRWQFGPRPTRAAIADKKTAVSLAVDAVAGRAVYQGRAGAVYVTAWPAATAKPRKLAPARKPTVTLDLLMGPVVPSGEHLYYFRRDPADQAIGYFEAWSVATRAVTASVRASAAYPLVRSAIVPVPARGTALVVDDSGFERGALLELGAAEPGAPGTPVRHAADVRQVLAVTADGRFVLATRRQDPARGNAADNPERIVVVDTVVHREEVIDAGGTGVAITAAGFVP